MKKQVEKTDFTLHKLKRKQQQQTNQTVYKTINPTFYKDVGFISLDS
jgi:hypothetical protein